MTDCHTKLSQMKIPGVIFGLINKRLDSLLSATFTDYSAEGGGGWGSVRAQNVARQAKWCPRLASLERGVTDLTENVYISRNIFDSHRVTKASCKGPPSTHVESLTLESLAVAFGQVKFLPKYSNNAHCYGMFLAPAASTEFICLKLQVHGWKLQLHGWKLQLHGWKVTTLQISHCNGDLFKTKQNNSSRTTNKILEHKHKPATYVLTASRLFLALWTEQCITVQSVECFHENCWLWYSSKGIYM